MSETNLVETDQPVTIPTGFQKIWQVLWNMKPLLGASFALCFVITIAIMIVMALIPVYLETQNVTVYQPSAIPFLVTYTTNQGGTTTLMDFNLDKLNIELMQQLNLQGTNIKYAVLSPVSNSKARRASNDIAAQCGTNVVTTGDLLSISFTIDSTHGCNYPNCKQKFIEAMEYQIATLSKTINLTLSLTDGTTIQIIANFCSINQTDSTMPTTTTTTTVTITMTTATIANTMTLTTTGITTSTTTSVAFSYRGLYVNGFATILGNTSLENSLLNWCVNNNFNVISLYDLNTIMGSSTLIAHLPQFIQKARFTYGINQVTAIRGLSANFNQNAIYDSSQTDLYERFTSYNLENEWWNNGPSCDFSCYTSILQTMNARAKTATPAIVTETYIGWFENPIGQDLQQANTIVSLLDRILIHDYQSSPGLNYLLNRILYLSEAANSQNRIIDLIVIFSVEYMFMFNYFDVNGQNHTFADAYQVVLNQFNAASFPYKNNVRLIGYQIYAFSWTIAARP